MSLLTADLYAAPEDVRLSRHQQMRLQAASSAALQASNLHRSHLAAGSLSPGLETTERRPSVSLLNDLQTPPLSSAASSRRSSIDPHVTWQEGGPARALSPSLVRPIPEEQPAALPQRATSTSAATTTTQAKLLPWRERLVDLILDQFAASRSKLPATLTERAFFIRCCDRLKRLDGVANAAEVAEQERARCFDRVMAARMRCGQGQLAICAREAARIHADAAAAVEAEAEAEADAHAHATGGEEMAPGCLVQQQVMKQGKSSGEEEEKRLLQQAEYDLALAKVVHQVYVKRLQGP